MESDMEYQQLSHLLLGNTISSWIKKTTSELIMLAIFLFWVAYYFIRLSWLKRVGIDLELAFKEVPPI